MTQTRPPSDRRTTAAASRRRQREKEILDATRALFDERGVRDAQIDDIARAVGTNRAIIYRHFSGKEELFAMTVVGYLDDLRERLQEAAATTDDPREQLASLIETFVDFGMEYPAFVDCAQALMRRPGPELFAEINEAALFRLGRGISACLGILSAALEAGTTRGDFKVDDANLLANHMYATGLGGLQLARVGMLIKELAPGVPTVAPISTDQVKRYLVATSLALASGAGG